MEFITVLWAPILLSAVFVFVVSSIIHMVLKYHANDFKKVPDQDSVQAALRPFNISAGDFMLPRADSMKDCSTPEFVEKLNKGPIVIMTVLKNSQMNMGKVWSSGSCTASWSAYSPPISRGMRCSRVAHTSVCFALSDARRLWDIPLALLKAEFGMVEIGDCPEDSFDGLLFAVVTAGTFGWLWPKM
ncbi:MAG: hypothetical protein IPH59_00035 [bacterium]|nr:hypothetical protein [bacterium]